MVQQAKDALLPVTGERMVTQLMEHSWANEDVFDHLHRYAKSLDFVKDKDVLDIASGEGYGSNLLSKKAKKVIGVDISEEAVAFASDKYKEQNLSFLIGSADKIPLPNNSVDVVVSFETLEHHDKHDEMLAEVKRVLRPGGVMIMSTPETDTYKEKGGKLNHFHIKELNLVQFKDLIDRHFLHKRIYFQRYIQGSFIVSEDSAGSFREFQGDFHNIKSQFGIAAPYYNICVASDSLVDADYNSVFHNYSPNMFGEEYVASTVRSAVDEKRNEIINSQTYRLGNIIASPFRILKKLLK